MKEWRDEGEGPNSLCIQIEFWLLAAVTLASFGYTLFERLRPLF